MVYDHGMEGKKRGRAGEKGPILHRLPRRIVTTEEKKFWTPLCSFRPIKGVRFLHEKVGHWARSS
jgi:hypothetical protein